MIEAEHISKSFGDLKVLQDVSFQVKKGGIYGLIGYNGVGKTTLLKILCGIYRPDEGRALVGGESVYETPRAKQKCFFMTEEATFFDQSSLMQMRKFYKDYYPGWSDRTFEKLVEWFGVDPDKKISQFSKGMQRQASLALAFSCGADYMFLDEAFDGLDYTLRRQLRKMLKVYAKERNAALLVSSHNLRELEDLADSIGMLNEGRLIFNDSAAELREEYLTCEFTVPSGTDPEIPGAELTEHEGNEYLCVVHGSEEEIRLKLAETGAENIRIRPVLLEEFFRKERKEKDVDWQEVFR